MKEVIVFFLNGTEYGVEISGMQSLENFQQIRPLPDAPEGILGTVKIREESYPVFDLKSKIIPGTQKVSPETATEDTKILLLRTNAGNIACIVDDVGKVFRAEGDNVQPFPGMARTEETGYIDFIARRDNELIVVINSFALLTEEQEKALKELDLSEEQEEK